MGIILPKESLQALKVKEGDTLYLTEAPNGSLQVNVGSPHFNRVMEIAEDCMDQYRNALRELAK